MTVVAVDIEDCIGSGIIIYVRNSCSFSCSWSQRGQQTEYDIRCIYNHISCSHRTEPSMQQTKQNVTRSALSESSRRLQSTLSLSTLWGQRDRITVCSVTLVQPRLLRCQFGESSLSSCSYSSFFIERTSSSVKVFRPAFRTVPATSQRQKQTFPTQPAPLRS